MKYGAVLSDMNTAPIQSYS